MSTINGIPFSSPKNINLRGSSSVKGSTLRFDRTSSANPLDSTSNGLYINASNELIYSAQGTTTVIGDGSGSGGIPTWETLFAADVTFNVAGTTWTIDNSTGNNDVLTVTNTGAGSGDLIQITNAGTGNDIRGDSNTWAVTKAGVATFVGISLTGTTNAIASSADVTWTLEDNDATAMIIGASGDTNMMTFDTSNAAPTVRFGDAVTITDGLLTAISTSNTAANILVTNNTITTFGATQAASAGQVVLRSTSLTTGVLLRLQLSNTNLTTGFFLECL